MSSADDLCDNELHLAAHCSDFDSAKKALDDGFHPDSIGLFKWSALHEAAYNGDLDLLKLLISYKGDSNKRDLLNGSTALHYASSEGHADCLEYLLSVGGNPGIKDYKGCTVSQVTRHKNCRTVLLKFGVNVKTSVHFEKKVLKNEKSSSRKRSKTKTSSSGNLSKLTLSDSVESEFHDKSPLSYARSLSNFSSEMSARSCSSLQSLTSIRSSIEENISGYITLAFQYNRKTSRLLISTFDIILTCLKLLENAKKDSGIVLMVQARILNGRDSTLDSISKSKPFKLLMEGTEECPAKDGSVQSFWSSASACLKLTSPLSLEFISLAKEKISTCDIEIAVLMQQKKSFLKSTNRNVPIGTMQLPLQQAVKRLLKERYELHNPEGDKNLNPFEVVIGNESVTSDSVIIGIRRASVLDTVRCVSDGDLQAVSSEMKASKNFLSPHSTYNMPLDNEAFELEEVRSHSVPPSPQTVVRLPSSSIHSSEEDIEIVIAK